MSSGSQRMTVAVAGASGFVGRHIVRRLLGDGHAVRGLVRDSARAAAVLPVTPTGGAESGSASDLTLFQGDIFDAAARDDLTAGADVLINCIGIRLEQPPEVTFERLHVRATECLLDVAERAGVRRFVQISALGVRPNAEDGYSASKYTAETLIRRSGLAWTIFRPSVIHGADSGFVGMLTDWARGRSAPFLFMPYMVRVDIEPTLPPKPPKLVATELQPVLIDDVAAAVSASLGSADAEGEVYTLTGPDSLAWPEVYRVIREHAPLADRKKPMLPIPAPLARAAAIAAVPLGLRGAVPYSVSETYLAVRDNTGDHTKASVHLGFAPAPFEASVAGYASAID